MPTDPRHREGVDEVDEVDEVGVGCFAEDAL